MSLTNINEKSEFKGEDSKLRFDDEDKRIFDDLTEIDEIAPDTLNQLKLQIESQKEKNRELKRKINANNEENAELEVVLSTCINELRDSLNICKVTTNNFTNIDIETKKYSDNLMSNIEILTMLAKQVSKNPSIHLLKSEAKFKLADKYLDRYNLKSNYKNQNMSKSSINQSFERKKVMSEQDLN